MTAPRGPAGRLALAAVAAASLAGSIGAAELIAESREPLEAYLAYAAGLAAGALLWLAASKKLRGRWGAGDGGGG